MENNSINSMMNEEKPIGTIIAIVIIAAVIIIGGVYFWKNNMMAVIPPPEAQKVTKPIQAESLEDSLSAIDLSADTQLDAMESQF